MRHLIFYGLFAACLTTVWYNYAPPAQREAVPPSIRAAIVHADAAFTRGMAITSGYLGKRITEVAAAERSAEEGRTWVASAGDGIARVYENPPAGGQGETTPTMFLGATLTGANLNRGTFDGALLDGADAHDASFTEASLVNASARLTSFKGAVFHRADLSGLTAQRAEFDRAFLISSQLRDASFTHATFIGAQLRGGGAIGTDFTAATMRAASFEAIDMRRAVFRGADLTGARFGDVQLHGAMFERANLAGADLRQTSGLTALALSGACGDATTRLPPGLSVSACDAPVPGALATGPYRPEDISSLAAYQDAPRAP